MIADREIATTVTARPILDGWWAAYTLDETDDAITAKFTARYGRPPAHIERNLNVALAGPIPAHKQAEARLWH